MDLTGLKRRGSALTPSTPLRAGDIGRIGESAIGSVISRAGRSAIDMAYNPASGSYEATRGADLSSYEPYTFQKDPGYEFRLNEGMRALERGAAARGGLLSGGFARKALRYAQDYASNEYQNVYSRIAGIAGFGQAATNASTNVVVGTGQSVGNALMNAGEARASGYVAQGNAWANAINQATMAYGMNYGIGGSIGRSQALNYGGPMAGGGLA